MNGFQLRLNKKGNQNVFLVFNFFQNIPVFVCLFVCLLIEKAYEEECLGIPFFTEEVRTKPS